MRLEDLSLTAAQSAIRTGALSPVEYALALFDRIERVEPQVQAWVTVDRDGALEQARQCEAEAHAGRFRGPLHGVPIGVKDIFYTQGLRTTMGSTLFKDFVPDHDAEVVALLRRAGAIIIGKTVTATFAYLDPGPTRNPWNVGHTPGGSSSGSGAAVAARMCPGAIGTQTVGSVSRPAAFNGIPSIVPTQQRISRRGVCPLAWSLDHVGAFGRSAADLELMMEAMARIPAEEMRERRPFRIGVVRGFFDENANAETRSHFNALAAKLNDTGFQVEEIRLPEIFALAGPTLRTIVRAEAASVHEHLFAKSPTVYGDKLRTLIETGMLVRSVEYLRARRVRSQYRREMAKLFEKADVLMTPAARGTAPEGIGSTGDAVMNGPWTLADFPIMTLPHALGNSGLPLGVQFCAPPLEERSLLRIAKAVEAVITFKALPEIGIL